MSRQFQSHQALKSCFSREMYCEVEETFRMLDTSNHNVITRSQLKLAERALGFITGLEGESDVDDFADAEQMELIDFDRYLSIILEHMNKPAFIVHESREAFSVFDKDGNGYLDAVGESILSVVCYKFV